MSRDISWRRGALVAGLSLCLLSACSRQGGPGFNAAVKPGEDAAQFFPEGQVLTVVGRLTYERKHSIADSTGQNPSIAIDVVPLRFVDVAALDASSMQRIEVTGAATDAQGRFSVKVPRGIRFFIAPVSSTLNSNGVANLAVRDPLTGGRFLFPFADPASGAPFFVSDLRRGRLELATALNVPAGTSGSPPAATDRPGAPFHILDAALDESELARAATGSAPPLVTFFWNAINPVGSFFVSALSGFGPSVFLLGGDSVLQDTDDQDDSVIRHEYGHALAFLLSRDASQGGVHGLGDVLYPALAYSEGFANFISAVTAGYPAYVDSAFVDSSLPDFFVINLEDRTKTLFVDVSPRTIRNELTVGELLWDLVDGANGLPDADADGLGISVKSFFTAFTALRTQNLYPSVEDLFASLVGTGALTAAQVQGLFVTPQSAAITFPPTGTDVFPTPVAIGGSATDTCRTLGLTDFAVHSGLDVLQRFFIVTVPAAQPVTFKMTLQNGAAGTDITSTNVDLQVRNLDNSFATSTAGVQLTPGTSPQASVETQTGVLAAGTYIVEVSGVSSGLNITGTDVSFRLDVTSP